MLKSKPFLLQYRQKALDGLLDNDLYGDTPIGCLRFDLTV